MIKKILSTLLVSSAFLVFAATGTMADRPTIAIGYTAAYGGYEASGQEKEGKTSVQGGQEINKASEAGEIGYSSLFMEVSFADRVTIGASWMVDAVTTAMQERTDSLCTVANKGSISYETNCSQANSGDTSNAGTSTVKAEFSNLVTAYVELNIWNGLYAKYGIMDMDVNTKESLHTDSQYPNASMDGETYGFGWKGSFDNGVFIKTETLMQDWSDLKIEATGATGDDNNTSVEASLKGAVATISIGKAF